jgi:hypothetical protein
MEKLRAFTFNAKIMPNKLSLMRLSGLFAARFIWFLHAILLDPKDVDGIFLRNISRF